jgi:hypothetical protein
VKQIPACVPPPEAGTVIRGGGASLVPPTPTPTPTPVLTPSPDPDTEGLIVNGRSDRPTQPTDPTQPLPPSPIIEPGRTDGSQGAAVTPPTEQPTEIPEPTPIPTPAPTPEPTEDLLFGPSTPTMPLTAQGPETPLGPGIEPGFGGPLASEGQPLDCEAQGLEEDDDGKCVPPEPEEPEISEEVPVPEEDNQQSFDQGSSVESAPSDGGEGGDFSESESE